MLKFYFIFALCTWWYFGSTSACTKCCLETHASLRWNRSIVFNNESITLKVNVIDGSPAHWIINYIFQILVYEKLRYRKIEFVSSNLRDFESETARLKCSDPSCKTTPEVHVNLLFWLPIGSVVKWSRTEPSMISNHGPLGLVHQWGLLEKSEHAGIVPLFEHNESISILRTDHLMSLMSQNSRENLAHTTKDTARPISVLAWDVNDNSLRFNQSQWILPPLCQPSALKPLTVDRGHMHSSISGSFNRLFDKFSHQPGSKSTESADSSGFCRTDSYQAVKLSWSKLKILAPLIHDLLEKIHLSNKVLEQLLSEVDNSAGDPKSSYREVACRWLRMNPTVADSWTVGWNQPTNISVAVLLENMTAVDVDYVNRVMKIVNMGERYLAGTGYAIQPQMYNVSCSDGSILSTFFSSFTDYTIQPVVATLPAVCFAASVKALIRIANTHKRIVISPTGPEASVLEDTYPYFFRMAQSLRQATIALLKLLKDWDWHNIAVFCKDDGFYRARLYLENNILVTEIQWRESNITLEQTLSLLDMMKMNGTRIFYIEYGVRGTVVVMCAAHHLNMHMDTGFVWILNPTLPKGWYEDPSKSGVSCSADDLYKVSNLSFVIRSQIVPPLLGDFHYPPTKKSYIEKDGFENTSFVMPTVNDNLVHLQEAVVVLADTIVRLLKKNPSAFDSFDQYAELFQSLLQRTDFAPSYPHLTYRNFIGFRFNPFNERIVGHVVLLQRMNNLVLPISYWVSNSTDDAGKYLEALDFNATERTHFLQLYQKFNELMVQRSLSHIVWGRHGKRPTDGSKTNLCSVPGLSKALNIGCTGAKVFLVVIVCIAVIIPVLVVASMYYQRKLHQIDVENRVRRPFEKLCMELSDLMIPMENVVLNRQIGQGAFGLVFGGEAKKNTLWEAVAVKAINEKATYEGKIEFLSEAKLMRSLMHKNVVRLVGIALDLKSKLYLIMELMLLGDLKTYLLSRRILAQRSPDHEDVCPSTLTQMSICIAQGLSYLHSKHLLHRDIACRNCLVGSDRIVKIADFGLTRAAASTNNAERYYRFTRNCELPVRWMSPEALQFGIYTIQSDIWSYGITLYEIITFGVFPYGDMVDVQVVERVKRREISITDFLPLSAWNTTVMALISHCCQYNARDRPDTMQHVLDVLKRYPDIVKPFLTSNPPKSNAFLEHTLQYQSEVTPSFGSEAAANITPKGDGSDFSEAVDKRNTQSTTINSGGFGAFSNSLGTANTGVDFIMMKPFPVKERPQRYHLYPSQSPTAAGAAYPATTDSWMMQLPYQQGVETQTRLDESRQSSNNNLSPSVGDCDHPNSYLLPCYDELPESSDKPSVVFSGSFPSKVPQTSPSIVVPPKSLISNKNDCHETKPERFGSQNSLSHEPLLRHDSVNDMSEKSFDCSVLNDTKLTALSPERSSTDPHRSFYT